MHQAVGGRLHKFAHEWSTITNDIVILRYIYGITLNFTGDPNTIPSRVVRLRNPTEAQALTEEIQKLLDKRVIKKCHPVPDQVLSSVFLVKKPNNSFRTIFNMKLLNTLIKYEHFKMDTLETAKAMLRKNWYLASVDLRDAYFTVPVDPRYRKYLRFQFNDSLYEFQAMPQGLTSAPRLFTKILKPVLAKLRGDGCICMAYLDDILILANTPNGCRQSTNQVLALVQRLGFIVNFDKSELEPTKSLVYLGYTMDTRTMQLSLPPEKVEKITTACKLFLKCEKVSLTHLAEIIGMMIAYCNASDFGPLHYRCLEQTKITGLRLHNGQFTGMVELNEECRQDLQWWIDNAARCTKAVSHGNPSLCIHTDASQDGWGAYNVSTKETTGGPWSDTDLDMSINAKELKAIGLGLKYFCKRIHTTHIQVRSDNVTAVAYIKHMGGTVSPLCNSLAKDIWTWCIDKKIWLSVTHIPGKCNVEADFGSRNLVGNDTEWELNDGVFQVMTQLWGLPEIDLFASRVNHKLPQYVAWRPDPNAIHIDAFTMSWENLYSYLFPPFSLLGRVLQKFTEDSGEALLVIPEWPSAVWFSVVPHLLVDYPLLLPQMHRLLTQGRLTHRLQSRLLACRLSGNPYSIRAFRTELAKLSWRPGDRVRRNNTTFTFAAGRTIVTEWGVIPYIQT